MITMQIIGVSIAVVTILLAIVLIWGADRLQKSIETERDKAKIDNYTDKQ